MATDPQVIKLAKLKPNPNNPRLIKDDRFLKLVSNLLRFPKFLEKRPIVHKDFIVQGGNMRLRSIEHIVKATADAFKYLCDTAGISEELVIFWTGIRKSKSIPAAWVADANDFSDEELQAFIIVDNVAFGQNDWDMLANGWDETELADWGVDYSWKREDVSKSVSFEIKPKADDNHSVFEQIMLHANKTRLVNLLNKIKDFQKLDKHEDALMMLVDCYEKHNPME